MTRPTPGRIDPSRTITLRRELSTIVSRQFARLRYDLTQLVVEEDAFGLRRRPQMTPEYVFNVYCPTGEGGGIDPTCSPRSSSVSFSGKVYRAGKVNKDGPVFYATDESIAQEYGSNPKSYDIKLSKALDLSRDDGVDVIIQIAKEAGVKDIHFVRHGPGDYEFSSESVSSVNPSGDSDGLPGDLVYIPKVREALKSRGYDGLKIGSTLFGGGDGGHEYVVLNQDGSVFNVYCPTGPGGGVDPTCSPKDGGGGSGEGAEGATPKESGAAKRQRQIEESARKIPVTKDLVIEAGISHRDYDAIEERMTREERDEMEESLAERHREAVEAAADDEDFDVSHDDVYEYMEIDTRDMFDDAVREVKKLDLPEDVKGEIIEHLGRVYDESGTSDPLDLLEELRTSQRGVEGREAAYQAIFERERRLVGEFDEAKRELRDKRRDAFIEDRLSNYEPDSWDRREYLREFYRDRADEPRFAGATLQHDKWGTDQNKNSVLMFKTSAGREYKVATYTGHSPKYGPYHEVQFSDAGGSFEITGAGNAVEVFSKVTAAVVAYARANEGETLTFSAAEESRQSLYDRLTRTTAKVMPGYMAVAHQRKGEGQGRYYVVAPREKLKDILSKFDDPSVQVDVLVNRLQPTVNWLPLEIEEEWFTEAGWPDGIDLTANVEPGRFAFASSETKVKEFGKWIEQQYKIRVTSDEQDQVWRKFIERSYKKGTGRAYDDYMRGRKEQGIDDKKKMDFYAGSKEEFLRSSFANPERIDKLKLLAARTFMDLEGATKESATKIRRALVEGLAQGKGPREIAKRMSEELGVAKWRALRIARTEIVRAHAEGQLNALEKLGVKNVGAKVEWGITKTKDGRPDPRVCETCLDMDGVVFTIKEARGRIPAHPNCRCAWLPVIEEAKKPKLSKKQPKPKPKKAPPPAPARKRPTKDDRPDELDRLEITFGKKKIAIIRDPRTPAKPKGKARPKRKPPKKRSPAPKSKKAAIRKSGKKTKPKPTSTTRRGAKTTVRKKVTKKTPKRPVARSRPKAGPTAKKRPTRNELYPDLIEFSRVIGNVFCPTCNEESH